MTSNGYLDMVRSLVLTIGGVIGVAIESYYLLAFIGVMALIRIGDKTA